MWGNPWRSRNTGAGDALLKQTDQVPLLSTRIAECAGQYCDSQVIFCFAITQEELPMAMTRAARQEELDFMQEKLFWDVVSVAESWSVTARLFSRASGSTSTRTTWRSPWSATGMSRKIFFTFPFFFSFFTFHLLNLYPFPF